MNYDKTGLLSLLDKKQGVIARLNRLLFDSDELIQWRAAEALGWVAREDPFVLEKIIGRLMYTLNDDSGSIGWFTPQALGEIGNSEDALMLATIAANPEHAGNEDARLSLARIEDPNTNTILIEGLTEASPLLRIEIISSLGNRGAKETTASILPYLSDPDENVRLVSLRAMERLGSENDII